MFWDILGLPGQGGNFPWQFTAGSSPWQGWEHCVCVHPGQAEVWSQRKKLIIPGIPNLDRVFQITLWECLELLSFLLASSSSLSETLKDFAIVGVWSAPAACYWIKGKHRKELLVSEEWERKKEKERKKKRKEEREKERKRETKWK